MSDPLLPILDTFLELRESGVALQDARAFGARPFPGRSKDRVAMDKRGAPAILVHSAGLTSRLPTTELAHLKVSHGVQCTVVHPDGNTEEATFSTLSLQGKVPALHDYFLRVVGAAVLGLPVQPSERDVSMMVMKLAELFNALTNEPRQSAQGLWGEVFVISQASDIASAVHAWRETPEATYDFSDGLDRVEVKSVVGEVRRHHFSLDQLRPNDGSSVTIISLALRQTQDGTSLEDLIAEVRNALASQPDVRIGFDRIVATTLGNSLTSALKVSFDRSFARANLRYFPAEIIPSITTPVPSEISEVRFRVDLSGIPANASSSTSPLLISLQPKSSALP